MSAEVASDVPQQDLEPSAGLESEQHGPEGEAPLGEVKGEEEDDGMTPEERREAKYQAQLNVIGDAVEQMVLKATVSTAELDALKLNTIRAFDSLMRTELRIRNCEGDVQKLKEMAKKETQEREGFEKELVEGMSTPTARKQRLERITELRTQVKEANSSTRVVFDEVLELRLDALYELQEAFRVLQVRKDQLTREAKELQEFQAKRKRARKDGKGSIVHQCKIMDMKLREIKRHRGPFYACVEVYPPELFLLEGELLKEQQRQEADDEAKKQKFIAKRDQKRMDDKEKMRIRKRVRPTPVAAAEAPAPEKKEPPVPVEPAKAPASVEPAKAPEQPAAEPAKATEPTKPVAPEKVQGAAAPKVPEKDQEPPKPASEPVPESAAVHEPEKVEEAKEVQPPPQPDDSEVLSVKISPEAVPLAATPRGRDESMEMVPKVEEVAADQKAPPKRKATDDPLDIRDTKQPVFWDATAASQESD